MIATTYFSKSVDAQDLPNGWEWVSLGNSKIAEIIMGQSPPGASYNTTGEGLPFFQGKAEFGELYPIPAKWCTDPKKVAEPGDILISVRAPVGPTNLVEVRCCIGRGLAAIRPTENVLTRYLLYILRAIEPVLSTQGKGSTFASINKSEILEIKIPIPFLSNPKRSLDIQQRIVARIEALLTEVRSSRKLLDEMRRDCDRLLNLSVEEAIKNITPKRKRLLDVLQSRPRNGWSPKGGGDSDGTPVLRLGAVLRFRYNKDEYKLTDQPTDPDAHYWLSPGDILISRSNTPELVGHAAIYSGEPYPCIYPDLMMRMRVNESQVDSRFLIYWLQTNEVRQYIQEHASGASYTMKKITQPDVCNIPFPNISKLEQMKLSTYLASIESEADGMLESIEQDTKTLDLLDRSILEQAFRGEL